MRDLLHAGRGVWQGWHVCRSEGTATVCPGRAWRARQGGADSCRSRPGLSICSVLPYSDWLVQPALELGGWWSLASVWTPSCGRSEELARRSG